MRLVDVVKEEVSEGYREAQKAVEQAIIELGPVSRPEPLFSRELLAQEAENGRRLCSNLQTQLPFADCILSEQEPLRSVYVNEDLYLGVKDCHDNKIGPERSLCLNRVTHDFCGTEQHAQDPFCTGAEQKNFSAWEWFVTNLRGWDGFFARTLSEILSLQNY